CNSRDPKGAEMTAPGLTTSLLIDGNPYGVEGLTPRWTPAESTVRMKNGDLRENFPYRAAGHSDKLLILTLDIQFDRVTEGEVDTLEDLRSKTGFIDVCYFKRITEWFSGDNSRTTFYLHRRPALTYVTVPPPGQAAD